MHGGQTQSSTVRGSKVGLGHVRIDPETDGRVTQKFMGALSTYRSKIWYGGLNKQGSSWRWRNVTDQVTTDATDVKKGGTIYWARGGRWRLVISHSDGTCREDPDDADPVCCTSLPPFPTPHNPSGLSDQR